MSNEQTPTSEKRSRRRARIARRIRVRPSDPEEDDFEDISVSINASRQGVYFATRREGYRIGLRVFVTYPYGLAHDPNNCEYVGEILRIDKLPVGNFGIAIRLLTTI
jgi:hypothetical protein